MDNIGHNSGLLTIQEQLEADFSDLQKRTKNLKEAAERVPASIADDTMSGTVADQVEQFRLHIAALKKAHETSKEPYLTGGRVVDTFFNPVVKDLEALKSKINARNTTYLTAKADREREEREAVAKAAAEAERQAKADAERAIAAAQTDDDLEAAIVAEETAKVVTAKAQEAVAQTAVSTADLTRIRSAHGTTTSLRSFGWKHRNVDRAKLDLEKLRPYLPAEAIDQAIRAYVKANPTPLGSLTGVEFYEDRRAA